MFNSWKSQENTNRFRSRSLSPDTLKKEGRAARFGLYFESFLKASVMYVRERKKSTTFVVVIVLWLGSLALQKTSALDQTNVSSATSPRPPVNVDDLDPKLKVLLGINSTGNNDKVGSSTTSTTTIDPEKSLLDDSDDEVKKAKEEQEEIKKNETLHEEVKVSTHFIHSVIAPRFHLQSSFLGISTGGRCCGARALQLAGHIFRPLRPHPLHLSHPLNTANQMSLLTRVSGDRFSRCQHRFIHEDTAVGPSQIRGVVLPDHVLPRPLTAHHLRVWL